MDVLYFLQIKFSGGMNHEYCIFTGFFLCTRSCGRSSANGKMQMLSFHRR